MSHPEKRHRHQFSYSIDPILNDQLQEWAEKLGTNKSRILDKVIILGLQQFVKEQSLRLQVQEQMKQDESGVQQDRGKQLAEAYGRKILSPAFSGWES